MSLRITVTQDFIDQRDARSEIYNPGKRTIEQLKRDIECEVYEWHMIQTGEWEDDEAWQIDGIDSGMVTYDVKVIDKWYNIGHKKMSYLLKQRGITDVFRFMEWAERPARLLEAGDTVYLDHITDIEYYKLLDNIQPSRYGGQGYYVDVRQLTRPLV